MPVLLLERLPLPSLEAYAVISASLLGLSLHYAAEKTLSPDWRMQFPSAKNDSLDLPDSLQAVVSEHWLSARVQEILSFSLQDSLCIWTVVNMAYCLLVLFGNWLQKQVFGELRVSELQHIKDKFWNFVFYKFIFIFGIINVQSMEGLILWGSWFSVIGFLHIHVQLCQDRFEYLSMTPGTPRHRHFRLLALLCAILFCCVVLFLICIVVGRQAGWITFALLAPECLLLTLRTSHVVTRYFFYLRSLQPITLSQSNGWSPMTYYVDLAVEVTCLVLDLAHHAHMLLRANMLLSMASLVIFMQLRVLYAQLCNRMRRHHNYRRMLHIVQTSCPLETFEIEADADWEDYKCAICWEPTSVARKLPCEHRFHHGCLLHWLEQDPTCPTCRRHLIPRKSEDNPAHIRPRESRWISWPSWTSWHRLLQPPVDSAVMNVAENSQLENLAVQVRQMFPDFEISTLIDDLRRTRSLDSTVENILEGRLLPTLPSFQQEPSPNLGQQEPSAPVLVDESLFDESMEIEFKSDPQERQHLLQSRKLELMEAARNRFIQRQASVSDTTINGS